MDKTTITSFFMRANYCEYEQKVIRHLQKINYVQNLVVKLNSATS